MSWIQDNLIPFLEFPSMQSALIVIGAVIVAKITDIFFIRISDALYQKHRQTWMIK